MTLTQGQPSILTGMSTPQATERAGEAAIRVRGLEKSFKELKVLRGVDIDLDEAVGHPGDRPRADLDAALLAAACDAQTGQRVIEAGCGAGGALLAAAARRPGAKFTGVERDPRHCGGLTRRSSPGKGLLAASRLKHQ